MPTVAPNGLPDLLAQFGPLMEKIEGTITSNNGVINAPEFALTKADIAPIQKIYSSLTPDLKSFVPKIIPPLLVPIVKAILPEVPLP